MFNVTLLAENENKFKTVIHRLDNAVQLAKNKQKIQSHIQIKSNQNNLFSSEQYSVI